MIYTAVIKMPKWGGG